MKESGVSVKIAEKTADQMIEVAAKYAKKWGRTSGVGFVTIYGTSTQGITVMDKAQLVKYLEKQKANLIDIIENDGVASSGFLKGKTIDLTDGDPEDVVFDIFLRNIVRLGIAVSRKDGEKVLLKVFNKRMDFRTGGGDLNSNENGGISSEFSAIARVTPTNLKPAFLQGVAGWEKLFKEMDKAAELTEKDELKDEDGNAKKILKKFINKHKSLFKLHDLNINADEIEDANPKNAFAYICLDKIPNKKFETIPFEKGIDIELWSYAAANNGNPCFSLAIEISNEDSCSILQKMVDLIIPYNQKKWDVKNKWNKKDNVQIKPEHFHQLVLEPVGVDFSRLKYDESQEILPTNRKYIQEQIEKNNNKDSEYYYSFFFNEYEAENAFDEFFNDILPNFISNNLSDTECLAEIQARRGQGKFRRLLMKYWENKCAVTDCNVLETLRASHAMPWAECVNANQRINEYNGFLLSANLDALFDKGLITFDDDGVIKISKTITEENKRALGLADDMHLRKIDKKHLEFLHYHWDNVWIDRIK